MPIVSNDNDLAQLVNKLAELERGAPLRDLAKAIGEEAVGQVQEGFRAERDPYGTPWKAITYRDGRILRDNGTLLSSIHVASTSESEVRIAAGVWYAIVHQEGRTITPRVATALRFIVHGKPVFAQSVTIPARPFFPRENDLPHSWQTAFDEVTTEWFGDFFGRK